MNAQLINVVKSFIEAELDKEVRTKFKETQLTHNHPPVRFEVKGCPFCSKFGNIFCIKI